MLKNKNNVNYDQKVLEVRNLKKHFRHGVGKNKLIVPAVDGLTFDIYKREVFGLVGESGCGKTTTGRTIIKLLAPTDGQVDLNGETIVAGYMEYIEKIQEIKEEAERRILKLDPVKEETARIKRELKDETAYLQTDIDRLKVEQKVALEQATKPLDDYKSEVYHAKSGYELDVETIEYDYHLNYKKIHAQTVNAAQTEYERELAGAKIGFERKKEGLQESAALKDEVIKRRIAELTEHYTNIYKDLETKFKPLIAEAEANIIPKEKAKEQFHTLKEEKKAKVAKRKEQYNKERAAIQKPDKAAVKADIVKVKADFKAQIDAIKAKITALKEQAKKDIEAIAASTEQTLSSTEMKAQIAEIKEWRKEAIAEQKLRIKEAKTINKSQEALEASQKMQMIFQDPISSLNPRMTVQEIVGEGLTILGGFSRDEIKEKVGEVLELVGLSREYAARYPHEFSGGQRQRIGVARALIMDPDFIIADEPISALDVSIRAQVINLLTELKERLGLTILFIAHDLSVVQFFCDRIAVMYYGKIVELTDSEELFKNPMHPYTRSLLSSIPQPDPDYEKNRKRVNYNPAMHDYRKDKPSLKELAPDHYVYANDKEFAALQEEYAKQNSSKKAKVN